MDVSTARIAFVLPASQPALKVPTGLTGAAKRFIDIVLATLALVFVSPLMIAIWAIIRWSDGEKAIFQQQRYGLGGRTFTCYKFRTMTPNADAALKLHLLNNSDAALEWARYSKLRYDPRVTRIGSFLRKTSLDELPQLINIIKGDMSIVGPRPIQRHEIAGYGDYFAYYCATRPGLTGLWQVSGRNAASFDERVKFDVAYVRNWTLLKDLSVMLRTIPAVLTARGAF